ncbi:MAG: hypothetical protein OZSIB_4182 [Candidatus Ozemobacter sibiricus]|jgi:tetratricopeptide (TPR) repeat protein|uniref:Uncharacterized protein n=1 Tax=Candidatus Ozemobacter sibiricus TaxID=2268124 RepID=A0A367ZNT9_9BACT|nr:MAG: hypothetical protein OZSIB_4182 [Candidatus Ozemobacter sibiricus]
MLEHHAGPALRPPGGLSLAGLTLLGATAAFIAGCGCGRMPPERSLGPVTGPGRPAGEAARPTQPAGGASRGLSILESAYITSPNEGFGRGKAGPGAAGRVARQVGADFERKYTQGVELMERGNYGEALKIFQEIAAQYSNTEEASVAEYCIAEIHFRNKANQLALEAYQRIVEKYPDSPAAQNAREGIEYLKTFEEHEREYVSPDVEDRKRRGF